MTANRKYIDELQRKLHGILSYDDMLSLIEDTIQHLPFSYFNVLNSKRFAILKDFIFKNTAFLDNYCFKPNIGTRAFYLINKMTDIMHCQNPTCQKPYLKQIKPMSNGCFFHCNDFCAQQDPAVKAKICHKKDVNHTHTRDLLERTKSYNMNTYGCEWYFQSDEFKQKKTQAWLSSGYDHPMHCQQIKDAIAERYLEKYGVQHPFMNEDIKLKIRQTNLTNYGVEMPTQDPDIKKRAHHNSTMTKLENYYNDVILKYDSIVPLFTCDDYTANRDTCYMFKWKCKTCGNEFEQRMFLNGKSQPRCFECNPYVFNSSTSHLEKEVYEFISSIPSKYEYVFESEENWKILTIQQQQLDILCKDRKTGKVEIAFEVNGIYWHQASTKPNNYHLNKTKACERLGIKLIHIWEDEWILANDDIKKLISDILTADVMFENTQTLCIDRSKFNTVWKIDGYSLVDQTAPTITDRIIGRKSYQVQDCGQLIYKKNIN